MLQNIVFYTTVMKLNFSGCNKNLYIIKIYILLLVGNAGRSCIDDVSSHRSVVMILYCHTTSVVGGAHKICKTAKAHVGGGGVGSYVLMPGRHQVTEGASFVCGGGRGRYCGRHRLFRFKPIIPVRFCATLGLIVCVLAYRVGPSPFLPTPSPIRGRLVNHQW